MNEIISKGTILICTKQQTTTCGIVYLKKGSIVKCAKTTENYSKTVRVYRNKIAERENYWHSVSINKTRIAKANEVEMYNKEIYFLDTIKTY